MIAQHTEQLKENDLPVQIGQARKQRFEKGHGEFAPGGVLLTCSGHEKFAAKEALKLLDNALQAESSSEANDAICRKNVILIRLSTMILMQMHW